MVRMSGLVALTALSVLVVSTFVDSLPAKDCNGKLENYRIWSLATQKFLTMKKVNGKVRVTFNGTGEEDGTASQGSSMLRKLCHSTMKANSWRYAFELHDNGIRKFYALRVTNDNTFTALEDSSKTLEKATSFVPVEFNNTGPLKALEVKDSKKCIAADIKDGSSSLKACNEDGPHPGTILVLAKP